MNSRDPLATAKIAAAYVGTITGAGFASGQELLQFFAGYGIWGLAGVAAAGWGFAVLGARVLDLGYHLAATGYSQILYHVCGRRIGAALDVCSMMFLFGGLCIMLAGSGAIARDFLGFPFFAGVAAMALLLLLTTLRGVGGIASANLFIMPLLILAMLAMGLYSLWYHGVSEFIDELSRIPRPPFSWHWLGSSLQYLSYNLVFGATMLAPLGRLTPRKEVRHNGAWAGGLLLAALLFWATVLLLTHYGDVSGSELPVLELSLLQHPWNYRLYAVVLLGAMYTTAAAGLYGTSEKLARRYCLPLHTAILFVLSLALFFSQFGFSRLIGIIYPAFGLLSCWFTLRLFWLWRRDN
ncbi:MAG: hypothetical protein E6X17_00830 [Sporomusaceae bacterium]|nr:hypothetical protein [Sporomusaceae bacterium]